MTGRLDPIFLYPESQVLYLPFGPVELVGVLNYPVRVSVEEENKGVEEEFMKGLGPAEHVIYALFDIVESSDHEVIPISVSVAG